jgi:outer membrane protein OmpA-like peptidoglycan-associated protein
MSFNILDAVKGYLTPDLITKASSTLNENESAVSKALSGIIPTVLSGFVTKAMNNSNDASDILDIVRNAHSSGTASGLGNFFNDNNNLLSKGLSLVQALFGDKLNSLVSSVASFAGIKNSSAASLFNTAGPLVASVIGKHSSDMNMSASSLSSFLHGQKTNILSMLPAGLSGITSLLGLSKLADTAQTAVKNTTKYVDETVDEKSGSNWLLWLLLLVLLGLAIWYFAGKGCNNVEPTGTVPSTEDTTTIKPVEKVISHIKGALDSIGNFIYDVGNEKEIKLADGTVLKVGENSTEAKLFTMLSDPSFTIDTVDKTKNWIVLDRVYFETGKAMLTAASQAQVKNIGAILKNFPKASIKLGGYTDNTGDASINKSVSDARAKGVASELGKAGAGAAQVKEAVGYGPEFPVCAANDTPECKAQNRRVDLKVASK